MSRTQDRIRAEAAAAEVALAGLTQTPPVTPAPAVNDGVPPAPPASAEIAPPDLEPTPAAPAPTPAAPAPAPAAQPVDPGTVARLQARLSTLEGMFNATAAERDQLRAQLQATPAPAPAPAPTPPATAAPITAAEREEYGDDLISIIDRAARAAVMPSIQMLLGRIERLEGTTGQISQRVAHAAEQVELSAHEKYVQALTALVPDWEAINVKREFLDFLAIPDIFSGKPRMQLLLQAHGEGDANRVAEFFKAYLNASGAQVAQPTHEPAPVPAPTPAPEPPVDLRNFVSPSTAAPAPASTNPAGGKVWTMGEIDKVYQDRMKGRISAAQFAVQETEINKAMIEGRIRT